MVANIAQVDLHAVYADGAEIAETAVDYSWLGMSLGFRAEPACIDTVVHESYCTMPDAWRTTRRRRQSQTGMRQTRRRSDVVRLEAAVPNSPTIALLTR